MNSIQIKSHITVTDLINALEQLSLTDLDVLTEKALQMRAKIIAPQLSKEETVLYEIINKGIPEFEQKRFIELEQKRLSQTLTTLEHQEGLKLIDKREDYENQRLEAMIKLSQIKEISFKELSQQLGLTNVGNGAKTS